MNKRSTLLIIAAGVLVVLIILLALYLFGVFTPNVGQQGTNTQPGNQFPTSGTATSTNTGVMVVKGRGSGVTLAVKDFEHNGQTIQDPHEAGTYTLASNSGYCIEGDNCPTGASATTNFSITYEATDNYFNILLLNEPLGQSRNEAEQFLEGALGISADQLCSLNYSVGTVLSVNATYAGEELGFSNCPGAVAFPQ